MCWKIQDRIGRRLGREITSKWKHETKKYSGIAQGLNKPQNMQKLGIKWALEKQIVEMKIASKSIFQKNKKLKKKKKKLQERFEDLCNNEVWFELEIQKLEKQKKEAKWLSTNDDARRSTDRVGELEQRSRSSIGW